MGLLGRDVCVLHICIGGKVLLPVSVQIAVILQLHAPEKDF